MAQRNPETDGMTRREVLKWAGVAGAGLVLAPTILRGGSAAAAEAGSNSVLVLRQQHQGQVEGQRSLRQVRRQGHAAVGGEGIWAPGRRPHLLQPGGAQREDRRRQLRRLHGVQPQGRHLVGQHQHGRRVRHPDLVRTLQHAGPVDEARHRGAAHEDVRDLQEGDLRGVPRVPDRHRQDRLARPRPTWARARSTRSTSSRTWMNCGRCTRRKPRPPAASTSARPTRTGPSCTRRSRASSSRAPDRG